MNFVGQTLHPYFTFVCNLSYSTIVLPLFLFVELL